MIITQNYLVTSSDQLDVYKILSEAGKSFDEAKQTIDITGISKIRYATSSQFTDFVLNGLEMVANIHIGAFNDIDAVIVVSQSYDQRMPSVSTQIQKFLKLRSEIYCIDVMDGCTGFIKALSLASMIHRCEKANKVLIVAGDLNSKMTNNAEIGTKILFGDGVSISILEKGSKKVQTKILNDGDIKKTISCDISQGVMNMNGFEVFRFTRNIVPSFVKSFLEEHCYAVKDFDLIALHQASHLVVSTLGQKLGIDNSLISNFACGEIGNLGAGSIGAWLSQGEELTEKGLLNMLCVGYGAGLSWGAASIQVNLQRNEVLYV